MNYAEDLWARINKDELSFISALNNLKDRMGYSKIEKTLLYLNYRITSADLNAGYGAIGTTLDRFLKCRTLPNRSIPSSAVQAMDDESSTGWIEFKKLLLILFDASLNLGCV